MIERTFYKGFEIRRHTFPYNGERRLLGYSVRKTHPDGKVIPYRPKKAKGSTGFHDTLFDTELDARQAIDTGDIVENPQIDRKDISPLSPVRRGNTGLTRNRTKW